MVLLNKIIIFIYFCMLSPFLQTTKESKFNMQSQFKTTTKYKVIHLVSSSFAIKIHSACTFLVTSIQLYYVQFRARYAILYTARIMVVVLVLFSLHKTLEKKIILKQKRKRSTKQVYRCLYARCRSFKTRNSPAANNSNNNKV